jgi:hypothetical protein
VCSVAPSTLLGWGIHIVPACAACRQPFSNTRLNKLQRDARAACSSYLAVENSVANEICCAPRRSSSRRRHSRLCPVSRKDNQIPRPASQIRLIVKLRFAGHGGPAAGCRPSWTTLATPRGSPGQYDLVGRTERHVLPRPSGTSLWRLSTPSPLSC